MIRVLRIFQFIFVFLAIWALDFLAPSLQPMAAAQTPEGEESLPADFFIEAEVDNLEPFLGQQVTYTLKRYQATDFPNQPHYADHPFAGFWHTPLLQRPTYTTTIAGREYRVHPTHIALFPTVPGTLIIDPARLIIPGDTAESDITVVSQAIQLDVQSWPENSPTTFDGAVGKFKISAEFDRAEVEVNQPVTLIVTVSGTGNIETLAEPTIPVMANWRFSRSSGSQIATTVPLSKDVVEGSRRFEWSLVPLETGAQFFPGIEFTYFDPETAAYDRLRTDSIAINVLPLPGSSTFASPLPEIRPEVRGFAAELRPIKPVPATLSPAAELTGFRQLLFLSCLFLPLLAIGGAGYWRYRHSRRAIDGPRTRRRRARRRSRQLLDEVQKSGDDPDVAIRLALTQYLEDKLGRPVSGLTSDQLVDLLIEEQLDPELMSRVRGQLERVEALRFAPIDPSSASTRSRIASARVLIDDLDTFFSKRRGRP